MAYIIFIKDDIVVAKGVYKSIDNVDLGAYDHFEEITSDEYKNIELASEKVGDEWVKTDKLPKSEYHKIEPIHEQPQEHTAEELLNALLEVTSYE